MKILQSKHNREWELPLKLKVSFKPVFNYLEIVSKDHHHYLNPSAIKMLEDYKAFPELRDGFEDLSLLTKYDSQIDRLLDFLFPDLLQTNEIKAASIPFEFIAFKLSKRFENIITDAGEDYEFNVRNYDDDKVFILANNSEISREYSRSKN